VIAYAAAVLFWRDPITDLYARYQQHNLAGSSSTHWPEYRTSRFGAGLARRRGDDHRRDRSALGLLNER
jgi:hypothetical protein